MTARPSLPISIALGEDAGEQLPLITNLGYATDDGVELRLMDWSGWDDTADVRANPQDVPAGDGAYDDGPLFSGRSIVLRGVARTDTPAALIKIGHTFRRLLAGSVRAGALTVTQIGAGGSNLPPTYPGPDLFPSAFLFPTAGIVDAVIESLRSSVRLGGATTFKKTHPTRAEWSLNLYAADARRYAPTEQSASTSRYVSAGGMTFPRRFPRSFGPAGTTGRITVTNTGDIPTGVRLTIDGACTNPQIVLVETGERIALVDTLTDGVVIDTNTRVRSVLRNGAPYAWVLRADSEFFQLPRGTSTLLFLADDGAPTLTATWSDATP